MEILVPISLGELYDKHSILWVKSTRITDTEKLKNIKKEMDILSELCKQHPIEHHYWYDLIHVNNHLWAVEDNIRKKESKKEYDEEFISYAREVYYTNDKRSKIKREINEKYGSDIIEEKSYENYE